MRLPQIAWLSLVLVLPLAAQAQEKICLRYAPAAGCAWQEKLSAELLDALMQGQPLGLKGSAQADVDASVTAVDEAAQSATVQLGLKNVQANLNGQASQPEAPAPLCLTVDQRGKMKLPADEGGAPADFMQTGGVPLQLISILAHTIRFPEDAVGVGEQWQNQDTYTLPGMGDVPIATRWKLMAVDGDVATIASTAAATIPDFKTPNPVAPGTLMDVRAARLSVIEMTQKYSLQNSRVLTTKATLTLEANIDLGGFEMPLTMSMKFELAED